MSQDAIFLYLSIALYYVSAYDTCRYLLILTAKNIYSKQITMAS